MTQIRPNSTAARDTASVLHPYTNLVAHERTGPLVIARGEGARVYDESGRGYIESAAGLWCASLGFSNERLAAVAAEQMRRLPFYHAFGGKSHDPMVTLAEMLLERAPVPMGRVHLRQFRLRGERQRREDGLVLQQRARTARQEEGDRPPQGLSRRHRRRRVAHRAARQSSQLRPAAARLPPYDDAALLP